MAANGSGAVFKGAEFEGTFTVVRGFSIFANASHNDATYHDGSPVLNAPNGTAALGLIYYNCSLYASVIAKYIGSTVQNDGTNPNINISGYTVGDPALVYTVREPGAGARVLRINFAIANLTNNRDEYFVYGTNLADATGYMTLPGRAYSLGISADF